MGYIITPKRVLMWAENASSGGIKTGKQQVFASFSAGDKGKHWIKVANPVDKTGIVKGRTLYFASRKDLVDYAKQNNIKING